MPKREHEPSINGGKELTLTKDQMQIMENNTEPVCPYCGTGGVVYGQKCWNCDLELEEGLSKFLKRPLENSSKEKENKIDPEQLKRVENGACPFCGMSNVRSGVECRGCDIKADDEDIKKFEEALKAQEK